MDTAVRWTVKVSKDTDISLRTFLARQGSKKGDLSKFIEEAVRWRVFDKTVQAVKNRNKDFSDEDLQGIIDAAVKKVRSKKVSGLTAKK
ncbi:MAG: ribbon-helix-helix domain-containing protein [Nitrospiria bacterium]